MKQTLDLYEQNIEKALERGEFLRTSDLENTKKLFQEAVKNFRQLQETRSITLRVKREDLVKVKAKANKIGIAYQTLINLLIRQYVNKEIDVTL